MSDENLDPYCPHCKEVVVPRYLREHHVPMCAKLAAEKSAREKAEAALAEVRKEFLRRECLWDHDMKRLSKEKDARIADLSARLEEAHACLFRCRGRFETIKRFASDVLSKPEHYAEVAKLSLVDVKTVIARLGSPSPVAALKDKVVESAREVKYDPYNGPTGLEDLKDALAALAAAQAQEKPCPGQ